MIPFQVSIGDIHCTCNMGNVYLKVMYTTYLCKQLDARTCIVHVCVCVHINLWEQNTYRLSSCYMCRCIHTVNWEIFAGEIFRQVKFSCGSIFVAMTTRRNKLTLFIHRRKYFGGLIFVIEDDGRKFIDLRCVVHSQAKRAVWKHCVVSLFVKPTCTVDSQNTDSVSAASIATNVDLKIFVSGKPLRFKFLCVLFSPPDKAPKEFCSV